MGKPKTNTKIDWRELKLWDHQKEAIAKCLDYYNTYTDKAYLVKLPTGSGKTAISAVLSRIIPPIKNTLIVVPSEALRVQNKNEINQNFWGKLGINHEILQTKIVEAILPSTIDDFLNELEDAHFVGILTAQALLDISKKKKKAYEGLKKKVSLIIFDEGHREPAIEWSVSIRNLGKPTILLSATPYRNDLKWFNADSKNFYQLSHTQAVDQRIIRDIEIIEKEGLCTTPQDFVMEVTNYFESVKPELIKKGITEPKIIIRCKDKQSIRTIVHELRHRNKEAIGIHEDFKRGVHFVRNVPEDMKYEYWVHQYKLTEGIDNPSFCVLAIYNAYSNSRSLIQQIGRITRNTNQNKSQKGYVLADKKNGVLNEWKMFLKYDDFLRQKDEIVIIDNIVEEYKKKHPDYYYLLNRFRQKIDFDKPDVYKNFRYKFSTNIFKRNPSFSLSSLRSNIIKELEDEDLDIMSNEPVLSNNVIKSAFVISYFKYFNSPILLEDLFIEIELHYLYILNIGDYLFYYSSEGRPLKIISDKHKRIEGARLEQLLVDATRFNQITLLNTDLGKYSIRSKALSAFSLAEIAPSLTDHQQVCSTISAARESDTKNSKRRYVGLTKARVSDSSIYNLTYEDLSEWLAKVAFLLDSNDNTTPEYIRRFANRVDTPDNTNPINILLDIDDIIESFKNNADLGSSLVFDELCFDVKNNSFIININDSPYEVIISFDADKRRYELQCEELNSFTLYENRVPTTENIISYLNRNQSFRLILEGCEIIYAHSHFYRPKFDVVGRKRNNKLPLLSIFNEHSELTNKSSEKGTGQLITDGKKWHRDTLFGLLARQGKGYSTDLEKELDFDIMVCNDLNKEESDFIGINSKNNKVVFIHCKALKETRYVSASVFQEVCGQLVKNLSHLSPYSERSLQHEKWLNTWSVAGIGEAKRIIKGGSNVDKIKDRIISTINDPNATKEVWIMLGNGFSLKEFQTKLNNGKEPELIQIIYLLTSTWEAASQVGAKLRIFC